MNKELLLDSFSYLDESLLERSELVKPRIAWHKWAGVAACFALIAVLGLAAREARERAKWWAISENFTPAVIVEAEDAEGEWDASYTPAEGETDNWDVLAPDEAAKSEQSANGAMIAWPDNGTADIPMTPMIEYYDGPCDAYLHDTMENGHVGYSAQLDAAMRAYGSKDVTYRVVVDLFRDGQPVDPSGSEAKAEMDRLSALGYSVSYERFYSDRVLDHAWFTLHAKHAQLKNFPADSGYGYILWLYNERTGSANDPNLFIVAGNPDASAPWEVAVDSAPADTIAVTPPFSGEYLTQEQAYADADFGTYLCEPPAGFGEREFLRMDGILTANFLRGYDYVSWHVSQASRIEPERVFDADELTPELVSEQMYRLNDAGDTDGLRVNFAVQYGDILVSVTAKGVTAEWLYSQLAALRQT